MSAPAAAAPTSPENPLPLPALLRLLQRRDFPHKLGICDRLFGRILGGTPEAWVRTAPGPVWKLDLRNHTHRWMVYGYYEGSGLWHWLRRRENIRVVIDSGANIGQTVSCFISFLPRAQVLAYEPGARARAWLEESVRANPGARVEIRPVGLGAKAGGARLGDWGGAEQRGSWNSVNATEGEPIVLATVDEELESRGIERVDFWKLDMEGYELEALRGAERALSAARIRTVYLEVAGENGEQSVRFLQERGYRLFRLLPSGRAIPWCRSRDYEIALCLAPDKVPTHG